MTDLPKFSVVIPTHNRVEMIKRALQSVLDQTISNYEIVIVDDASTDATPRFLATVASSRLGVLRNETNLGVSGSRNKGVRNCKGEFVVFLDDDDELRPNALACLQEHMETYPGLDFLWGGRLIHEKDSSGRVIAVESDNWAKVRTPIFGSTFLPFSLRIATNSVFAIKRTVFHVLGEFDEKLRLSEDRDLFIRLARGNFNGGVVAKTIINVDGHVTGSLSRGPASKVGPVFDLLVIDKHSEYLNLSQHRDFLNAYLLIIYSGFLQASDRRSAGQIRRRLKQLDGAKYEVARMYLRHAPEFRALKMVIGYNAIRRIISLLKSAKRDRRTAQP